MWFRIVLGYFQYLEAILGGFLPVLAGYLVGRLFQLGSDLVLELELEPGTSSRIGWNQCNTEIQMTKF